MEIKLPYTSIRYGVVRIKKHCPITSEYFHEKFLAIYRFSNFCSPKKIPNAFTNYPTENFEFTTCKLYLNYQFTINLLFPKQPSPLSQPSSANNFTFKSYRYFSHPKQLI